MEIGDLIEIIIFFLGFFSLNEWSKVKNRLNKAFMKLKVFHEYINKLIRKLKNYFF